MGLVLDRLELRQLAILALGAGLLGAPPLAFARPEGAASLALLLPLLAVPLVVAQHLLLRRSVLRPVLEAAREDHDRLAASEARFATAAEAIPDGLAIFDAEERLVYYNRHYPELLAEPYRATLELGQPIDRWVERARAVGPIYHPEMGEDFLERRLALKKLPSADHEHRLADGRWMRVRERRMENGGRILLVTDISEARAQAAALEASRERFRSIVDDQVEFISRLDRELRFTFVNEAYARQLGRSREDLLGSSVLDLMTEGQRARFVTQLATLGPERPTVAYEMEGRRADGSPSIEAWVDRALFDRDGRVIEYQSVGRDVTEERRAAEALRASEARLAAFMAHAPVGVHIKDVEGRYLMANPEMAKIFRRPVEQVLGLAPSDLFPPEEAAMIDRHHRAVVESGRPIRVEEHQPSLDAYEWAAMFRFPIRDADGRITGVGGFAIDITPQKRAQAELEASEARFRAIAESVPMPLVITALSRRAILFANSRARAVFDLGTPGEDLDHAAIWVDVGERERIARRVVEEGFVEGVEVRLKRADGTVFDAMLSVRLIDYGGEPAALGAIVDISELRRTEQALRASEARLAAFLAHAPVAMCLEDIEGRYQLLNPEMRKILGRPVEEAIGKTPFDLFPEDEAAMIARNCRAVMESGEPLVVEEHQPSLDAYAWSTVIRFPVKDEAGRVIGAGGFAVDITAQKRAQAELAASEARFRTIAELQPVPLTITRLADRKVMFANRAYYATFGLDPAEIAGDFDRNLLYEDPAEREAIFAALGRGCSVEGRSLRMRAKNGRVFPVVFEARPIVYDGEACGVAAMQDVSELEAAEAEIRRQREALHQTEKLSALGTLLAGVAHELNNPLSVVVGYASLLREQTEDAAVRARAERIHTAAERCARIVKTFLAMARQKPPAWGVVRAEEVIEAALELAGYQLRSVGVEVERDFAPGLPAIWGDADQLHQVLTNLVVNAHQALLQVAPPRRLRLSVRRLGPDRVAITVEDNGPGMSEEVRQRIFEPFFTTKPQGVGTGVGLAVCHGIVGAHRGRIEVESAPGAGTRVRVVLPIAEAEGPAAPAPALESPERRPARARILVVDDEAEIAELVAERLRGRGFAVETAASGRAALDRLAREEADAIVTDLRMPEVDGPALLEEVRRRYPRLAGRIVIVTGDALSAEVGDLAREAGLPVLEKPLDLEVLEARLRDLLATPASSAGAARGAPAG